jgi:hypothetical protein
MPASFIAFTGVSLETMKIVRGLPALDILEEAPGAAAPSRAVGTVTVGGSLDLASVKDR